MAGIKELRVRIKSVGSIKQITKAMEMVATTKLRRFQDRAISSRPYAQEIAGLVGRLAGVLGDDVADNPLFIEGSGDKTLVLAVSSDRGLCGAYNSNLFKTVIKWSKDLGNDISWFLYGRKITSFLGKRDANIERVLSDPTLEEIDYRTAAITARMLTTEFLSGKYKDVYIIYSAFETMAKYVPTVVKLLPIDGSGLASDATGAADTDVLLEPDAETIFERIIPRYLETRIYNCLLESLTSEYASRRFAMKSATDAATDMQKALQGVYNRKRQEKITMELLDLVGGVEAVK
ncbi:MAG: F-type H+-transporting ATPase subunit gamma [Planctomycetota bacterium]|jgi:F-type H+-transporting ATPase subunit gamma